MTKKSPTKSDFTEELSRFHIKYPKTYMSSPQLEQVENPCSSMPTYGVRLRMN
jgi:hypothetical protein